MESNVRQSAQMSVAQIPKKRMPPEIRRESTSGSRRYCVGITSVQIWDVESCEPKTGSIEIQSALDEMTHPDRTVVSPISRGSGNLCISGWQKYDRDLIG